MKRIIVATLATMMVGGCASSHNLRDGESALDGGYQVSKVNNSIFYIYTRTNASMFIARYEDAQKTWQEQALLNCKGRDFAPAKMARRLNDSKIHRLIVAEVYGYAICAGSGMTDEQIRKSIERYERGESP